MIRRDSHLKVSKLILITELFTLNFSNESYHIITNIILSKNIHAPEPLKREAFFVSNPQIPSEQEVNVGINFISLKAMGWLRIDQ